MQGTRCFRGAFTSGPIGNVLKREGVSPRRDDLGSITFESNPVCSENTVLLRSAWQQAPGRCLLIHTIRSRAVMYCSTVGQSVQSPSVLFVHS